MKSSNVDRRTAGRRPGGAPSNSAVTTASSCRGPRPRHRRPCPSRPPRDPSLAAGSIELALSLEPLVVGEVAHRLLTCPLALSAFSHRAPPPVSSLVRYPGPMGRAGRGPAQPDARHVPSLHPHRDDNRASNQSPHPPSPLGAGSRSMSNPARGRTRPRGPPRPCREHRPRSSRSSSPACRTLLETISLTSRMASSTIPSSTVGRSALRPRRASAAACGPGRRRMSSSREPHVPPHTRDGRERTGRVSRSAAAATGPAGAAVPGAVRGPEAPAVAAGRAVEGWAGRDPADPADPAPVPVRVERLASCSDHPRLLRKRTAPRGLSGERGPARAAPSTSSTGRRCPGPSPPRRAAGRSDRRVRGAIADRLGGPTRCPG